KVHQLNSAWSEDRKESHITRHAVHHIHSAIDHPPVVRLWDVFEISSSAFATVLEFCAGPDLDHHLAAHQTIAEREAKSIIVQVLQGLRYLNTPSGEGPDRRQGIIHYDLKPGNILFDDRGEVKITDFGLSKIVEEEAEGTSMDLTSQGAGTYWYLPPECFQMGDRPPRISSKVDVWSVGVIFFQMLYGRRPFGEGQAPQQLLHSGALLRAGGEAWRSRGRPSRRRARPSRGSAWRAAADRPTVRELCRHPYLS
ncbi:unnamed protein product, partial [Heterosigma akashiwo]